MSDEFDVEKWRKENPIDYLKMIELILEPEDDTVKKYVFDTLYEINRRYIPDYLYKYYSLTDDDSLNKLKLTTLDEGKIFMSDPKDFNDPFDGKAFFYNKDKLSEIDRLKEHNGSIIDDFTKFWKVTSLTGNDYNNMPMWAHYSNNHAGYCVCYNMKDKSNLYLNSSTFKVQYVEDRVDITDFIYDYTKKVAEIIDRNISMGIKTTVITNISLIYIAIYLSFLKMKTWDYEDEYRCSLGKTPDGNNYCTAIPCSIYIGAKCTKENEERLIEIAKKYKIPVFKMFYEDSNQKFELIPKQINY